MRHTIETSKCMHISGRHDCLSRHIHRVRIPCQTPGVRQRGRSPQRRRRCAGGRMVHTSLLALTASGGATRWNRSEGGEEAWACGASMIAPEGRLRCEAQGGEMRSQRLGEHGLRKARCSGPSGWLWYGADGRRSYRTRSMNRSGRASRLNVERAARRMLARARVGRDGDVAGGAEGRERGGYACMRSARE